MLAAWLGAGAAAVLIGGAVYLVYFHLYHTQRVLYGSEEVRKDFEDLPLHSWPIPKTLHTWLQFVQAYQKFPAPHVKYLRRTFSNVIWPELGEYSYDEGVYEPPETYEHYKMGDALPPPDNSHPKGVCIVLCPMSAGPNIRCVRRTVCKLLESGYHCYVLVSRGYGGAVMDARRQKVFVDEYWNIQDIFELLLHLQARYDKGMPPLHLIGQSLGGMRLIHFLAQVARLLRKIEAEAEVEGEGEDPDDPRDERILELLSGLRNDSSDMLSHACAMFDTPETRSIARLLQDRLLSASVMYADYDVRRPYLAPRLLHKGIVGPMRFWVKKNEEAMRVYLEKAFSAAGKEQTATAVDEAFETVAKRAVTLPDVDSALVCHLAGKDNAVDYYTAIFPNQEEFQAIAEFTRASRAGVMYFATADDTVVGKMFPHDYIEEGPKSRTLGVVMNRGDHLGTVLSDGNDVASWFVLRNIEAGNRRFSGAGDASPASHSAGMLAAGPQKQVEVANLADPADSSDRLGAAAPTDVHEIRGALGAGKAAEVTDTPAPRR